ITERKFRYIAQLLGMGGHGHGATRLYDVADVGLVRLCLRLEAETSLWLARAAVLYNEPKLRLVLGTTPVASAMLLSGNRALLTTLGEIQQKRWSGTVVALRDVWRGVREGMRDIRRRTPEIWVWKPLPATVAVKRVVKLAHNRVETH